MTSEENAFLSGVLHRKPGTSPPSLAEVGLNHFVPYLINRVAAQWNFGYLPGGGNHQRFAINEHHRRAANLIAQIPLDARLSVQDKLNPHVANRETLYIFPRIDDADTGPTSWMRPV